MLTPFRDNGEIDYRALAELTEFYLGSGAVGLFANCLSSEMFNLSPEEHIKVISHVVKTTGGRVPVVATGNFGKTIADQAESINRVYDAGIDAVIVVTCLIAEEGNSDQVFNDNLWKLMELTAGIPLGLYECPVPYKKILSAAQLNLFLESQRLIYYKDTCLDIEQVRAKVAVARSFDFKIYDAYMGHAAKSLRAGVDGLSCIQGNFFPEIIVWLCRNYNNPALSEEIDLVQKFLLDNMDVMHAAYPPVAKYFLQIRGMQISPFSRANNDAFTPAVKNQIDGLFDACEKLKSELGI